MNTRLQQFIQYKTGGKKTEFAHLMGWSPQYLNRLIQGDSGIGIKPIIALLKKFPELNARWLLLGEGNMIVIGTDEVKERLYKLMTLERYLPVMTVEQQTAIADGQLDYTREQIYQWETLLQQRKEAIDQRFERAFAKQKQQ